MDKKKIRAAIYTRVSTKDETAEAQLQKLQQYVHQRSFTLHRDYVDYASDGSKKRKSENKAYQELLVDASKGLIDCVIVWNYDSFARSLSMLIEGLEQFNKLGVDFISYTQNIDTTAATGQLFYNVIGSLSEFNNKVSGENVKAGLAHARAKGVRLGRPEKDPIAASRIAALREEGWSLRKIAQQEKLSAAGVLKVLNRNKEKTSPAAAKKAPEPKQKVAPETTILWQPSDASLVALAVPEICQLKIFLCIIEPQVWRRVLVPSDITLEKLHEVIQILFDWDGYSEHEFVPTDARGNGVTLKCDEAKFRFNDLGFKPGDRMLYEYGLLDWTHDVVFEKNVPFEQGGQYPVCTDGRMTSPPEDCGSAMAFMDKLSLMKGRKVKGSKKGRIFGFDQDFCREIVERGGLDAFDKEAVNKRLAALAPAITRNKGKNESKTLVLVSSEKQTKVTVHIYIERNSKFVRGKKNAREDIERYCLSEYQPTKLRDGQYELTFTYRDSAHLDDQAYNLIQEIHNEADMRNCFAEVSLSENGTDRRWS